MTEDAFPDEDDTPTDDDLPNWVPPGAAMSVYGANPPNPWYSGVVANGVADDGGSGTNWVPPGLARRPFAGNTSTGVLPAPARSPHQLWGGDRIPYTVRRQRHCGFGWHPDHPDGRDTYYDKPRTASRRAIDLRKSCPQVYNQGPLASCTAQAIAAALVFEAGWPPETVPSRLFIEVVRVFRQVGG